MWRAASAVMMAASIGEYPKLVMGAPTPVGPVIRCPRRIAPQVILPTSMMSLMDA
jgi:hypothetical protein